MSAACASLHSRLCSTHVMNFDQRDRDDKELSKSSLGRIAQQCVADRFDCPFGRSDHRMLTCVLCFGRHFSNELLDLCYTAHGSSVVPMTTEFGIDREAEPKSVRSPFRWHSDRSSRTKSGGFGRRKQMELGLLPLAMDSEFCCPIVFELIIV
jgi:hypothetical protein